MNDILKPELVWIKGRCYRSNDGAVVLNSYQEENMYEEDNTNFDEEDTGSDEDYEVTLNDNSRYSTSFHIPQAYLGSIIGRKAATKSRIEHETRTTIKIPKQGQSGSVVIFGSSAGNVKAGRRRVNMIVMSSRRKQKLTHFLSIPLNVPPITESFKKIMEKVLSECPDGTIDESIFVSPSKLHLTIAVMTLMDSDERTQVTELLIKARESIIIPLLGAATRVRVRVRGLSIMNDDPHHAHVLYARITDSGDGLLQNLCDKLYQYFMKTGFVFREFDRDHVKLHMTLMKSSNRKSETDPTLAPPNRGYKRRQSFDVSPILETYADYDFGECDLECIHLSQINATAEDGYYQNTYTVSCY